MESILNEDYNFGTYIAKENALEIMAAKKITEKPGKEYNPVLIYGSIGVGKTHLIQAIGNELKKQGSIVYTTAELLTGELIEAIMKGNVMRFKNKYRDTSALLVEDIQYLRFKSGTTEGLTYIFNALYEKNIQMIFTADREISGLEGFCDHFISMLSGGLCLNILPPDFEKKCMIIKNMVLKNGINLEQDSIKEMANETKDDIRDIISRILFLKLQESVERRKNGT
jgi:chromosomal replication initiator protein